MPDPYQSAFRDCRERLKTLRRNGTVGEICLNRACLSWSKASFEL